MMTSTSQSLPSIVMSIFRRVAYIAIPVFMVVCPATSFASHGLGSAPSPTGLTFLPAGHWEPANLPMTVIFPQPTADVHTYARQNWAYCDNVHPIQYRIPVEVDFGALPYVFQLVSGPPGMSIAQSYWIPGDTAAQMHALHYGDVIWTPNCSAGPVTDQPVDVRVWGQDKKFIDVKWNVSTSDSVAFSGSLATLTSGSDVLDVTTAPTAGSVLQGAVVSGSYIPAETQIERQLSGTSGGVGTYQMSADATGTVTTPEAVTGAPNFVFLSPTGSDTNVCSYDSPCATLEHIYGPTNTGGPNKTYPAAILYLMGGTYATYNEDSNGISGILLSGSNNPITIMGIPGQTVTLSLVDCISSASVPCSTVFSNWDDASDEFIQNLAFTGIPATQPTNGFTYFFEGYNNDRMTYDDISAPDVYAGPDPAGDNASLITYTCPGGTTPRKYLVIRGVSESNRSSTNSTNSYGVQDIFCTFYGVDEFSTETGDANDEDDFYLKSSTSDWDIRYNMSVSAGSISDGVGGQYDAPGYTSDIEIMYNVWDGSGAVRSAGALVENWADTASGSQVGPVWVERNTIDATAQNVTGGGAITIASPTTVSGPFVSRDNAIEYASGSYPVYGATLPANVTNTGTECQATSGVFNSSYQLISPYTAYAGECGATIQ